MNAKDTIKISVVVPLYNEEDNIVPLYVRLTHVLTAMEEPYEIVFVDDGSNDTTPRTLYEIYASDSRVKVITLRRNFGQTAALKAGFDQVRGDIVISMDGDLQHDPEEIPDFIRKLDEGYDLVSGWRAQRRDAWLTRRLPSRAANSMIAWLSGVELHDFGTTFKAYRSEVLQDIHLYGDLHRFIPPLAAWSGARITEIPINNPPRLNGKSNYGISRVFRVLMDLLSTKFLLEYLTRPLHFFGLLGLVLSGLGTFIGSYLVFAKVFWHQAIMVRNGPLFFAVILLILAGIQLVSLGLGTEILSRTYFESQKKPIYATREVKTHEPDSPLVAGRESHA
ncbi:MAG TPA: glycosyltransferase family 2 protein [Terriglobia bacterium]|nr:glycosyltransferase family 2 protein [Terriglobia bacterium]